MTVPCHTVLERAVPCHVLRKVLRRTMPWVQRYAEGQAETHRAMSTLSRRAGLVLTATGTLPVTLRSTFHPHTSHKSHKSHLAQITDSQCLPTAYSSGGREAEPRSKERPSPE